MDAEQCYCCKRPIGDDVVWLAEDYRDEGGQIEGPYAMHARCAAHPWPLYEISPSEALLWPTYGKDAWALAWASERSLNAN